MANSSPVELVTRLRKTEYVGQFRAVFGTDMFVRPEQAFAAILKALDAFESSPSEFSPYSSRYDAFLRGDIDLEPAEERGAGLFKDPAKGNCASCHVVTSRADKPPAFTDYDYANVGVPRNPRIAANTDPKYFDLGLCGPLRIDLAGRQEYCGMFRAPSLRNVAIRDAFFHNGVFGSLRQVLEFYVERDLHPEKYYSRNADGSIHRFDDMPPGSPNNVDRDPPLDREPGATPALSPEEIDDLIAFLKTLTDADVATVSSLGTSAALRTSVIPAVSP
jgi:cytochrome c peroxidase